MAARLVSVNVGLPRDITWRGRTVHTGIWKNSKPGRVMVRRLNIDGDGQGDLSGHGGVNRAVMVYQTESTDTGLAAWGVASEKVHSEIFGAGKPITPGIAEAKEVPAHAPAGAAGPGPQVSFARSKLSVCWDPKFSNLLDFAEACDVPVRWSCRTGVCHTCESGLISGSVAYDPEPLEPAAEGNVLICCARPQGEVVIDL